MLGKDEDREESLSVERENTGVPIRLWWVGGDSWCNGRRNEEAVLVVAGVVALPATLTCLC